MAAVNQPIDLKPAQAQSANASAPGLIAAAATAAPTSLPTAAGVVADSGRSVWMPLAEAATEYEAVHQPLNAAGQRRIVGIYERQTEAVSTLVSTDDQNRQSLTLLPGAPGT